MNQQADNTPKTSASVIAQQAAMLSAGHSDTADFDDAFARLFGTWTRADHIRAGRWFGASSPYGFLLRRGRLPCNPSLWRRRVSTEPRPFEVVPGVYQIRGLDIAQ